MRLQRMALAAAAVVGLAACGGGSGGGGTSSPSLKPLDHHVTVSFWHVMHSGAQLKTITQLTNEFNAGQQNVTVQLVDQVSYNNLNQKTLAALAAGSPPTAAQCYENWADQYRQSGALAALSPLIDAPDGLKSSDLSDFFPIMLADGKLGGKQYMLPFNKSDLVLYYNAAMLSAAGIDKPPATWDQLKADAPRLTGNGHWALDFTDQLGWENTFAAQVYAYGGTILDKDQKKATFNQQPGQQILQLWRDLVASGDAHRIAAPNFDDQNDFAAGKTAFYISTIASFPFTRSAIAGKFAFHTAQLPAGPKGVRTEMFGTNACIFSKAPQDQQQGAFQFIKFFTGRQGTSEWATGTGYMPVRQSAYKELQSTLYAQTPDLLVAPAMLPNAIVEPPLSAWNEGAGKLTVEIVNALDGKKSVKQALDDAATQVNDLLAGG